MPSKFERAKPPTLKSGDSRHKTYDARRMQHPELGPVATFRGSTRWKCVRAVKREKFPVCEDPFKVHELLPVITRQVHHVIPLVDCLRLGQLDKLGLHLDNLRSLCFECHARVEEMDTYDARRLFLSLDEEFNLLVACNVRSSSPLYEKT